MAQYAIGLLGEATSPVWGVATGKAEVLRNPSRITDSTGGSTHIMRPIDPWLAAVGFALAVLCVAAMVFIAAGADAARIVVLAIAGLLYALAALARALKGQRP